jgi:hypothetical protein
LVWLGLAKGDDIPKEANTDPTTPVFVIKRERARDRER